MSEKVRRSVSRACKDRSISCRASEVKNELTSMLWQSTDGGNGDMSTMANQGEGGNVAT